MWVNRWQNNWKYDMSANRLFLVCSHCQRPEEALLIAERPDAAEAYVESVPKRADQWFLKHAMCAPGCDHFQLAYARPHDWDLSPPAQDTVAGGVKMALVNGSHEGETEQ